MLLSVILAVSGTLQHYKREREMYEEARRLYLVESAEARDYAMGEVDIKRYSYTDGPRVAGASREYVKENASGDEDSEEADMFGVPWYDMVEVDFEDLMGINRDICGWIYFENEKISYPLLYSKDNMNYLRTAYDGRSARSGSIFLDGGCEMDLTGRNSIIYGHNMRDLSMFGRLRYYRTKKDYYEDHQYFQILNEDHKYRYRIFAFYTVSAEDDQGPFVRNFDSKKEFDSFIQDSINRSLTDTDVEVGTSDHLVTLSTCVNDDSKRFVVQAVLVDMD